MAEVAVANHTWFFKTYRRSFTGDDLIRAIVRLRIAPDTKAALMVGNALMRHHVFHAVWGGDVEVMSTALLYRFSFHEELLGGVDLTNISVTYVLKTAERMEKHIDMVGYDKAGRPMFQGQAMLEWLTKEGTVLTEEEGMQLCNLFVACKLTSCVTDKDCRAPFSPAALYIMSRRSARASNKETEKAAPLGVLRLEYGYPPIPGDIDHPSSFPYDVIYRKVPGLTFELAQSGDLPEHVRDCGFMANYQRFVAESTAAAPVFMSSLCLIPTIMAGMKADAKLLVLTANSALLAALLPNRYDAPLAPAEWGKCEITNAFLRKQCGCAVERPERIVNMGLQDLPGFQVVAEATSLLSPEVDRVLVGGGIAERVVSYIARDATVQAILLECTELPHFSAPLLRNCTGLPVFDALSVCDFFQAAVDHGAEQAGRRALCLSRGCQRL
eukprot:jgi/Tetstr1/425072/TSEL_015536.t1